MKPLMIVCAALLVLSPRAGLAQEFQKRGLPCVAEICLGDGIAELAGVSWERAKRRSPNPEKAPYVSEGEVSPLKMSLVEKRYKGDLTQAAPYLEQSAFDAEALPALSKVTAACQRNQLTGIYTTAGGNRTRVGISLIPDLDDPSVHRWTVDSIIRGFPAAVTNEQKAEVEAQLNQRYHAFGAGNQDIRNPKPGEGRVSVRGFPEIAMYMSMFHGSAQRNLMKQHAACGGGTPVSID